MVLNSLVQHKYPIKMEILKNSIPLSEEGQEFYVLFAKNPDFPHLYDKITDKNIHITGISANSVQLSIEGEINIDHLAVSNAQFRKKKKKKIQTSP